MDSPVVLGIDIGGTNTVYGFISEDGHIHDHEEIPTKGADPVTDLVGRIESRTNQFLNDNPQLALSGIGVGAPNGNHFTGMIQDPPNLSWGNVNIVELFKKRFNCKTSLTNDANAAALGEKHYGIAKNMNDFIVITLGTGLGSGIFSGGRLLYGHDGFAGEMGHMPVEYDGRNCNCGNRGCLESYASASGIKKTIEDLQKELPTDEFLNSIHSDKIDGLLIDSAFDNGNELAKRIYQFTGNKLGQGLAQAATLLSPEAFIFYGGFSNAGDRILKPAKASMDRHLINGHAGSIDLIRSGLPQGQAGILGAASLIWAP
tara:strand:- start:1216 stop:2163 length:948 start_codon:yes stop_codon:yes gene_type:complete